MSGSHSNPAEAARKAMDPDGNLFLVYLVILNFSNIDPDFMAKRVPLLDIMKKMQNL